MANRHFTQFKYTLERAVVELYARVSIGAVGAPTLDTANSKGIVSVSRSSAGKLVFVFGTNSGMLDLYNRILDADVIFDTSGLAGAAPAAPVMNLAASAINTPGSASVTIQLSTGAGVATDPASGEVGLFRFSFKNSTAP